MPITAVDYDPFAKQATPAPSGRVEPVDYDPFSPAASPQPQDGVLSAIGKGITSAPALFQRQAGGLMRLAGESGPPSLSDVNPALFGENDPQQPDLTAARAEAAKSASVPGTTANIGKHLFDSATQDLKDNAPHVAPGSVPDYAYKITQGLVAIAPIIGVATATKSPAVAGAMIAGQSFSEKYGEARDAGRTVDQAKVDAGFTGLVSGAMATLPIGVLMKPGGVFLGKALTSAGAFGFQSVATEALQMGYDKGVIGSDMTVEKAIPILVQSGIVGAATGFVLGAGEHVVSRSLTPREQPGTALPTGEAPIDPQDVHPGDESSPIPTHIIAAGRKIVREATSAPQEAVPGARVVPRAPDAAALGLNTAPEQAGQPPAATTPYIGVPQEAAGSAASPDVSGPTPTQMADVKSLLSQDNTAVTPPQSAPQEPPAPTPAPAPAEPAEPASTGRPAPAEPDYSDAKTRAQTYSKWLDELDGQRRMAAAQSPMANLLRTTEASILNKVGGVESRLTNAAAGRLAEVRGALDELLNPVGDSPDMARVRAAMVEQHQKMADAAAPPPITERSPAAEPDRTQPQAVAAERPLAATATQPEIAPAQVAPQPVSSDAEIAAPTLRTQEPEIPPENKIERRAPETTGDGTQAAPIVVTHPDHLATAEANVNTSPTEAQAAAGNYEHGHVKIKGLDIAIENPKGSVRRGVDADGKPWEVSLPSAYGYIKRSTAADGEQVDAYVGSNPQSSKVFVIDQKDAKTGAYDEAKSFIGFDTKQQVLDTYHAAFSDGLGPQRMGGVREMNTLQFKKLLNSGALDKPVAGEIKPGVTAKESAPAPLTEGQFHSQYVQHVDLRGRESGKALETRDSILRDGFKKGANVNAMPPSRAGEGGRYAPRKGDVVYLAPKGAWKDAPNGPEIQNGWKPRPHEAVQITDPSKSMYDNYRAAWNDVHSSDRPTVTPPGRSPEIDAKPDAPSKEITVPPNDTRGLPPKTAPKEITPPPSVKPAVKAAVAKDATAEAPAAVAAEPKPRALALKPLEGTGEERSRAINDATYRSGEERPQKEAAEKLVAEDPEGALAIALRQKQPPPDLHPEFVYMAMESKATREGDTALAERLKQSRIAEESTTMGQRIGAWKNRDPLSAVSHMQAVETARAAVLEQKTGSAAKAVTAEAREITKQVQAAKKQARALTPREKWAQTIAAITCKA